MARTNIRAWSSPLEPLEPRCLLAQVTWDGGGGDLSWDNPLNWSADVLPGPGDDVLISPPGAPTISLAGPVVRSVGSLRSLAPLTLAAGTLALGGPWRQSAPLSMSGGHVTGGGDLILNADFQWTAGAIDGPGRLMVYPGRQLTIDGSVGLSRDLYNNGSVLWNSGDITLTSGGIYNQPGRVFTARSPGTLTAVGSSAGITNYGTFIREGDPGTTTTIAAPFNNTTFTVFFTRGVVGVRRGTLSLAGGVAQKAGDQLLGGSWFISSSSARLLMPGPDITRAYGTYVFNGPGSSFPQLEHARYVQDLTISGGRACSFDRLDLTTEMYGATTLTINNPGMTTRIGPITFAGLRLLAGDAQFTGAPTGFGPDIRVAQGSTLTVGSADLGTATLTGPGVLRITGEVRSLPVGGYIPGQLVVTPTGHLTIDARESWWLGPDVTQTRIVNYGAIDINDPYRSFTIGTELVNRGMVTFAQYYCTQWDFGRPAQMGVFTNFGTLNIQGTTNFWGLYGNPLRLNNRGLVRVQQGTLSLASGFSGAGQWQVDAGAELVFKDAPGSLDGATIGGSGQVRVQAPVRLTGATVSGDGALVVDPAGRLTLAGSTTVSRGLVDVQGRLELAPLASVMIDAAVGVPGVLALGTGSLTITGGLSMTQGSTLELATQDASTFGHLTVQGLAIVSGTLLADFGWPATAGVMLDFITAGSHSGQFGAVLARGLPAGLGVQFAFTANTGMLTVV